MLGLTGGGVIAAAGAGGYATLGTVVYEASNVAYPANTGVTVAAVMTCGMRVTIPNSADPFHAFFGGGASHQGENGTCVFVSSTNNRLNGRIGDGVTYVNGPLTAANSITSGAVHTIILSWDGSAVRVRIGDAEVSASHSYVTYTGRAIEVGGQPNQGTSWDLVSPTVVHKAVIYSQAVDRAALTTLLNAEA